MSRPTGPITICSSLCGRLFPRSSSLIIFFWGLKGYLEAEVAPGDAQEIQVTAKQWVWQFQYPDGTRAINEVHVRLNRPVKFLCLLRRCSPRFFVPDMRVKHDVLPDRYVQVWFTPDRPRQASH